VLMIALVSSVPRLPAHEALRAHNAAEFASAFAAMVSWPSSLPFGLVVYAPALFLSLRALKNAPKLGDNQWFNLAAFGWVVVQFFALAMGRAQGAPLAPRYLDTFQIGIAITIVSALFLMPTEFLRTPVRHAVVGAAILMWFSLLVFWAGEDAYSHLRYPIEVRRQTAITETDNVRGYLSTGDYSFLANKPLLDIPHPSAERLRQLLDDPAIRSVLPPGLSSSEGPRDGIVELLKAVLLRLGYLFVGSGILLSMAAICLVCVQGTRANNLSRVP